MFREAFEKRRCLVPAPIYYEWRDDPDGKVPFAVARVDGSSIQDRVPVIIAKGDWALWLGEIDGDPQGLLRPAAEGTLRFWPIDKKVGNVRNDGPELIRPVAEEEPTLL
jgi:putative SOS response-associated peptidase YedK